MRRFVLTFAGTCALLSVLPAMIAWLSAPAGSRYLGIQYNVDDHMVYAAWMRQGSFFLDNRFTLDSQPGITVHIFFFLLGLISKLVGIPMTFALARAGFSFLFVVLLAKLASAISDDERFQMLALVLTTFGGGVGYLVWQNFGQTLSKGSPEFLNSLMIGRLPTDVWQPEGFIFPSMITNPLFMVSLCLILGIFLCFLNSLDSKKSVWIGFICMALLMNIHSYDSLLITLVMVAFGFSMMSCKKATIPWLGRCALIGAGAILPAMWFIHVLKTDSVFQARAATETFSPNFRQIALGYLPLLLLASFTALGSTKHRKWIVLSFATLIGVLFFLSKSHTGNGYWFGWGVWIPLFGVACVLGAIPKFENKAMSLVWCWGVVGLIAPYLPELFQRKLTMGLCIPLGLLAAYGLSHLLGWRKATPDEAFSVKRLDPSLARLAAAFAILVCSGTSIYWFQRELSMIRLNQSNTTMHPVYLSEDLVKIVDYLNGHSEQRNVVLAMPGVQVSDETGQLHALIVPDWNPILSGLTGSYTFAGHWSETPDYVGRRARLTRFFLPQTSPSEREELLHQTKASFIVAPVPSAFENLPLADLSSIGETLIHGKQFDLIQVRA